MRAQREEIWNRDPNASAAFDFLDMLLRQMSPLDVTARAHAVADSADEAIAAACAENPDRTEPPVGLSAYAEPLALNDEVEKIAEMIEQRVRSRNVSRSGSNQRVPVRDWDR